MKQKLTIISILALFTVLLFFMFSKAEASSPQREDAFFASQKRQTEILLAMRGTLDDEYELYRESRDAAMYQGASLSFSPQGGDEAYISENGETARYPVTVPEDAFYILSFDFCPEGAALLPTVLSVRVDGEYPFRELRAIRADNIWRQDGFPHDRYGNECVAMPWRDNLWQRGSLRPVSGSYSRPMALFLTAGSHEIEFSCGNGAVTLATLHLDGEEEGAAMSAGPVTDGGSGLIILEAEQMTKRNNPNIRSGAEYNTALTPYSSRLQVQNLIDDESFRYGAGLVEYEFEVEEEGYYYLRFAYRQAAKQDFHVFRNIYLDGQQSVPAFVNAAFPYSMGFRDMDLADAVYLTRGTHSLGIEVSLDYVRAAVKAIEQIVKEMNDLSLQISSITGGNTERFRDFNLLEYGIDAESELLYWADCLDSIHAALLGLALKDNSGEIERISSAAKLLRKLAERPDELPKRLNEFSHGASSARQLLTATLESLQVSPLGLDKIILYQDADNIPGRMGPFDTLAANVGRFFATFQSQDYSPAYNRVEGDSLQVWVTRPRQYLEIMQQMADSGFTEQTGIKVDLALMPDQSKLILANAANQAPDAAIAISSGGVYDLALRGALHDMRTFDNFKEVGRRFAPGMLIPGVVDEGVYAIPETFNFFVLFYRSDILDALGLPVPDSMQEVRDILPQLRRMGMNFNSHVANYVAKPFAATTPFIYQSGGEPYDPETGLAAIDSMEAIAGLAVLTENFTIYNMRFDIQSFYQYFRDGRTPLGVSDYGTFNLLTNAAPELAGHWGVALYPGIANEDGEVLRWTSGAAESCVIFSDSEKKEEAWMFLDWWMSADVQNEFAFNLQTTLGNEYMWNSANLEAMAMAPWNREHREVIARQLIWTWEPPRVPGAYMLERELSNAVNAVVDDGRKLQMAIDTAQKTTNREINRKLAEFGYTEDGEFIRPLHLPTPDSIMEWLE